MSVYMEPKCNFCAITKAVIYCKSYLAKLCIYCDGHIHSANLVSLRHTRSLTCQKCFSQPSVMCCVDEKVSYCQGCQWHENNCSSLGHRLQSLKLFSGCPSPSEFFKMWSSILETSSVSGLDFQLVGSFPLTDPNNVMLGMTKINELDSLIGSSYSTMPHDISYTQSVSDQYSFVSGDSKESSDLVQRLEEEEDLCEEINLDDAPLNFDVGDDISGCYTQKKT